MINYKENLYNVNHITAITDISTPKNTKPYFVIVIAVNDERIIIQKENITELEETRNDLVSFLTSDGNARGNIFTI